MAYQQAVFGNGEFYHIYNRGVEKRSTFIDRRDFQRFLSALVYYTFKKPPSKFSARNRPFVLEKPIDTTLIVEIVAFCLMDNHFHLIIRQVDDQGITKFMSRLLNSYTKYFNTKYDRVGPLFQGAFKAVRVESNEQLIHLSRYIHLNPLIDYKVKDLDDYEYSSYLQYVSRSTGFCQFNYVIDQFASPQEYQQFVLDQEGYGREIKLIERAILDQE